MYTARCSFILISHFPNIQCISFVLFIFRLNKIGKNPNIVSQKDDDEISNPDESAINAVVNALAAADLKDLNLK